MSSYEKWDYRFIQLAKHVSSWSKDPSTKVGAVVVEEGSNLVVGMGYNGFPRGMDDTPERLNDRPLKYKLVVHAEVNAILNAGDKAFGASLYVWPAFAIPNICNECSKVAIQAGIAEVVGPNILDIDGAARWKESIDISRMMLEESGVGYRGV